jgi:hypothetical protein
LFEIKLESSGLRREGGDFAMPIGHSHISVSRINRKKRSEAEALQKQKPTTFPQQDWQKVGRRDRCFFVGLKYKDPSLKIFFKGPSEKIFLLTLPSKNSRRPHTRFA